MCTKKELSVPHIIIEHNRELEGELNLGEFAKSMHKCLSKQDTVKLNAIKTRLIPVDHVLVGDNSDPDTMIHITILLLTGRSSELKETMANAIFYKAQEIIGDIGCSLSVNVDELGTYVK